MDYCQKIQILTDVLLNSESQEEKWKAKEELIELCSHIPDVDEKFKTIKRKSIQDDLKMFLESPKLHKDIINKLRINLKQLYNCPDVKTIMK